MQMFASKEILMSCLMLISGVTIGQNVGINTDGSVPTKMLHIKIASGDDGIRIQNNSGTGDGHINFQDGSSNAWTIGFDASDNNDFKFSSTGILGNSDRLVLDENADQILSGFDGSATTPAWTFLNDNNSGLFSKNGDELGLAAGGLEFLVLDEGAANDRLIINETAADIDFRIESSGQENIFYVDGGTDAIGIRTNTPNNMLEMRNNGINVGSSVMAIFRNDGTDGVALAAFNSNTTNNFAAFEGGSNGTFAGLAGFAFVAGSSADGVLGNTADPDAFGVVGARVSGSGAPGSGGVFYNDLTYTGGLFNISDLRTKRDVKAMDNALSIIEQLDPVTYKYRNDEYSILGGRDELEYGFIAQDVNKVLPEIVEQKNLNLNAGLAPQPNQPASKNLQEFYMVDYSRLIPILTKALQEQQSHIKDLEERLEALEK